jgi:hypothetical protein
MATSVTYDFWVTQMVEGKPRPIPRVRILHDPAICDDNGLECNWRNIRSTPETTREGYAQLQMIGTTQDHWFRVVYGGIQQDKNAYVTQFGGSRRTIGFDF